MANTFAPFGFLHVGFLEGAAPTFGNATKRIAAGNATAIYQGDPVTQLNTGYIAQSTAGSTQIHGIFVGCKYLSTSQGRTVWRSYWPGSDATGDVEAYVINSPQAIFRVQANTNLTLADVGNNGQFAVGTGNTTTGISGSYINGASATTATYPFRIVDLVRDPPGANGTDVTSANNWVVVTFNNQDYKSTTGI